jgi:regulatory protein YycI of two-component signal transduction system YycFG
MDDKYPRVTQNQLEIWLSNSVTISYLNCLKFYQESVKDSTNKGEGFDMENNDKTCNMLYFREGLKEGYRIAGEPENLLNHYEMLESEGADNDKDA